MKNIIYAYVFSFVLMEHFYPHIDSVVENQDVVENREKKENQQKKKSEPGLGVEPISHSHILRVENRVIDLPESPHEKQEIPIIPDIKKAEEDYNSIDYQIIAFNLWRSKAKELF